MKSLSYADLVEADRCRALWRAVLNVGLEDALRVPRAALWVSTADRNFRMVCWLADVEPEAVVARFREYRVGLAVAEARRQEVRAA